MSISKEICGIWTVRLPFISDTLLFVAIDGVRKAAYRSKNPIQFILLPLFLAFLILPLVLFFSIKSASDILGFIPAAIMTSISSLLEIFCEVWAIPQLSNLNGLLIAKIHGPAYLLRSISAVLFVRLIIKFKEESTTTLIPLAFGFSNLLFGLTLIITFFIKCGKPKLIMPHRLEFIAYRPFAFQSILQWLFFQGENIILMASVTSAQLGVFGFVRDLSSLLCRIVFNPVETSVLTAYAINKNSHDQTDNNNEENNNNNKKENNTENNNKNNKENNEEKDKNENISIGYDFLFIASRAVVCIGLIAAAFGPSVAASILKLVYRNKWQDEGVQESFSAICRVLPVMALNGVVEAFANARLSRTQLEKYNFLLMFVSFIYFGLIFLFTKIIGVSGPIWANFVNMTLRSLMGIFVVNKETHQIKQLLPKFYVIFLFISISILSEFLNVKYIIIFIPISVLVLIFSEKELVNMMISKVLNRKNKID